MNNTYLLAENKYGRYCVPKNSKHRLAPKAVLKGEVWEQETIDFILSHCDQDLIHAGAYFGDMLPAFSTLQKVWAFEPCKENYDCAIETIKLNHISNVHLVNAAVSNSTGTSVLMTRKPNQKKDLGGASRIVKNTTAVGRTESIKTVTIDKTIPDDRVISIIHLDVEGHELFALKGAKNTIERCSPILILETKSDIKPNLRLFLKELRYKLIGTVYHDVNSIWKKS